MVRLPPPRLISVYFGGGIWAQMAAKLLKTASRRLKGWEVDVRRVDVGPHTKSSAPGRRRSLAANCDKMWWWNQIMQTTKDGERLLFIDTDTVVLRSLDDIWKRDFDKAITAKESRFPFNSGVVFVRSSTHTRRFFADWLHENERMLADEKNHTPWRTKYGGLNQASLGYMLEQGLPLKVIRIPCREWNCEDSCWRKFDSSTRILHVKGELRRALFEPAKQPIRPHISKVARAWRTA